MLRRSMVAVVLCLSPLWACAQNDCQAENTRQIEVGLNEGFEGQCSNNGQQIRCIHNKSQHSWSCEGPQGHYNAHGDELTQTLIVETCGCFSNLQ